MPANLWPGDPLVVRKATLASLPTKAAVGIRFNEHNGTRDGGVVFYHACKLGLEGIVSKRKDSTYRSGRSLRIGADEDKSRRPVLKHARGLSPTSRVHALT
jgi:hypothetical protein